MKKFIETYDDWSKQLIELLSYRDDNDPLDRLSLPSSCLLSLYWKYLEKVRAENIQQAMNNAKENIRLLSTQKTFDICDFFSCISIK